MKINTPRYKSLALCSSAVLLLCCLQATADIAIIIHPDNQNRLNEQQISRLFLGRLRDFPSGDVALPIDQAPNSAARQYFSKKVLKKNQHQLRSYWSKLIFSGKAFPPEVIEDSSAIKQLVASNPKAISYIDADLVDDTVKVIKIYR